MSSNCVLYLGKCDKGGYGHGYPHRKAYLKAHGSLPLGRKEVVMHLCNTPNCINPEHLKVGSQKENIQMAVHRNTHACKNQFGKNNPNSKISREEADQIRDLYKSGHFFQKETAKLYNLSQCYVSELVLGKKQIKGV